MPQVSFIVIAHNVQPTIKRCIESILEQDVDKQVIVVNNNSTDGTSEEIEGLPITLLFESKPNRGMARNRGLQVASGDFIAFVDADVELPDEWTQKALDLLKSSPDIVAVGGPGMTPENSWVSKALDALQYEVFSDSNDKYVLSLPTMDVIYRGDCIRNLRFEEYWAAEDPEFNFRLLDRGHRLLWSRKLSVLHHHPISLSHLLRKSFKYGEWLLAPYIKHPAKISFWIIARVIFLPSAIILGLLSTSNNILKILMLIWLLLPFFAYFILALRGWNFADFKQAMQFVFVHTLKQYAQMMGIWAGIIRGTWRVYL